MSSIDQTLEHLKQTISQEQEAGRINSMASLATSKHRRAAITRDWQAIQAALLPIQQAIKALPDLPAEEPMKWAQNLLKMSSCLVLEVDTTGLDEEAEICRVTFATINGSLFDDILIRPSLGQIPAAAAAVNGITSEQIAHAPSLPDVWSRIREGFEGRYTRCSALPPAPSVLLGGRSGAQVDPILSKDLWDQTGRHRGAYDGKAIAHARNCHRPCKGAMRHNFRHGRSSHRCTPTQTCSRSEQWGDRLSHNRRRYPRRFR